MRWTPFSLCLVALLAGSVLAEAQTAGPADDQLAQPAGTVNRSADTIAHFTLGQSAVPLYGPWKFTVGDSPIDPKTGQPLWAEPGFDDSKWETVDLTPKDGAFDPIAGLSGYVPGWTAKGHPGYFGYAWYRIRVNVKARSGAELALAGPANVDDAYQVFDNGKLAGQLGNFTGGRPVVYLTHPKMFLLALPDGHEATTGHDRASLDESSPAEAGVEKTDRVLAFRLWMEPVSLVLGPDAGGMHSAPVLGEAGAVTAGYQMGWLELIRAGAAIAAQALLFGLLAVVAFTLILFDRSDRVYLWVGALFLLNGVFNALIVIGSWTEIQSIPLNLLLADCLVAPLGFAVWVMVFWVWFGLKSPPWLPRLTAGLTVLLMVSSILGEEVFFGLVPHAVAIQFVTVSLALRVVFFALLLWVVVEGIRKQGVEGWMVLPLVVLRGIIAFSPQLRFLRLGMHWFPFGVEVNLATIAYLMVAVVISLLLLRRLIKSVKRQRQMALDVKQAQEVQQMILPKARVVLPGVTTEREYPP